MLEKLTSSTDVSILYSSDKVILNNALDIEKSASDMSLKASLKYFDSITLYMTQLRSALAQR
jgi:hypothetical protein